MCTLNVLFRWIKGFSKDNGDGNNAISNYNDGSSRNSVSIKPKLDEARRLMQLQIARLDTIQKKLYEKDRALFAKVTQALQERDMQYASILSNELAHVRKVSRMISHVKLALEQIQLRLSTISDLGDIVVTLSPAMSIVKGIRQDVSKIMPEFDGKMQEMYDVFSSIMIDTTQVNANSVLLANNALSSDAQAILEEATSVVEDSIRARLPDLPQQGSFEMELPEIKLPSEYTQEKRVSSSNGKSASKDRVEELLY
jgi:division protein CdvB (Snf7/Vps24/ESCRT-III family)